jgi:hypothetical protein
LLRGGSGVCGGGCGNDDVDVLLVTGFVAADPILLCVNCRLLGSIDNALLYAAKTS